MSIVIRSGYGTIHYEGHIYKGYFNKNIPNGNGIIDNDESTRGLYVDGKLFIKKQIKQKLSTSLINLLQNPDIFNIVSLYLTTYELLLFSKLIRVSFDKFFLYKIQIKTQSILEKIIKLILDVNIYTKFNNIEYNKKEMLVIKKETIKKIYTTELTIYSMKFNMFPSLSHLLKLSTDIQTLYLLRNTKLKKLQEIHCVNSHFKSSIRHKLDILSVNIFHNVKILFFSSNFFPWMHHTNPRWNFLNDTQQLDTNKNNIKVTIADIIPSSVEILILHGITMFDITRLGIFTNVRQLYLTTYYYYTVAMNSKIHIFGYMLEKIYTDSSLINIINKDVLLLFYNISLQTNKCHRCECKNYYDFTEKHVYCTILTKK
jgi:hypothetical protein